MHIAKLYKDQEIFITGGSGFIGKALIEKLLRSCTPGKIHVLLRPKKGRSVEERLKDILDGPLYDRLRKERPESFKLVHAIEGDCAELGLGIKVDDLEQLQNVNIIFHSAASVRFDDALRDAILLNMRGTYELIKLAERQMPHLKVLMHVSTTYCNPHHSVVEEEIYPAFADWRTTIKLAETYNTETLNVFYTKYSNHQPNTYTFTKGLAEQLVNEYKHKLPLIIFRPSIVISSIVDPIPGWVDNFNGPVGMLVACGVGIMRTNYADPNIVSDFVPVDIVVRAMIIAACVKTQQALSKGSPEEEEAVQILPVYNCATANFCPITTGEVINIGKRLIRENPFEKTLWVPGGSITRCYVWNLIRFMTLHVFMALLVDFLLLCANKKPFLLRLQRRIYAANLALYYFLTTSWDFKNKQMKALDGMVDKSEFDTFGFLQYSKVDYDKFFNEGIRGAKRFLLKESADASNAARFRLRIFQVLHYCIQFIGAYLILRILYVKLFT